MILWAAFIKPDDMLAVLSQKLWAYHKEHPAPLLHLHLDKTIYNTNEDIWFKAYILNPEADSSNVLYVRLTDINKKIILTDQFPVTDIRANGDIMIPDTLKDGSYYLYAYTNRMINFTSKNIFVQRITVTHNSTKRLYAEAAVVDTNQLKRGHNVQIQVRVKDGDDLLKNIKGEYRLITDGLPTKVGKLSTNQFGEAMINFIYPNLADDKSLNVKIAFKNNTDFTDLTLNLKHEGNAVQVKLFPEGGHYIAGMLTKAVVQATDIKQNHVAANVVLKGNNQVVTRVQLHENGQGIFYFTPAPNTVYTIEAESNGNKNTIPFNPVIENKGYTLKITKQKDNRKVVIKNLGCDANTVLILRSFEEILWSQPITVASGDSAVVNVPTGNFSKQVLNVGVFDKVGDLLSERLFLNDMGDDYHVSIKTDQQIYGLRKKVTVSVNVSDASGKAIMANLSIAAVEKTRIEPLDYRDILNTWYLKFVDGDNYTNQLLGLSEGNIDATMITKNWRQGRWDDVIKYNATGHIVRLKNTDGVVGYVKPLTKKPGKLKELTVLSKSRVFTVPLNDERYFFIAAADLLRPRGEKEYLMMNTNLVYDYEIHLLNYSETFDGTVTGGNSLFIPDAFNSLAQYQEVKQAFSKGVIQLKEVKIKSNSSTRDETGGITNYRSTNCNDLVCMYNILNCRNHPGCCTTPVDGVVYSLNGKPVIYHSCVSEEVDAKTHIPLKGISIPKQFYLADYDKEPSYEPELHSTIYWNPNINTDSKGNATFSFFTSDISGDFLITAQGVDASRIQPLSGKGTFKVK
jgi:hypothetical protein